MKRLQVLLLVALSSTLLLFGCGKEEEVNEPAGAQVIEKQSDTEPQGQQTVDEPQTNEAPADDEAPPADGMV